MTKKYTVTLEEIDGKSTIIRKNDGFSALELLGIVTLAQQEIIQQMNGIIKPDIIKREVVED